MSILDNSYISFVNLPHRIDRLEHIIKQLDRVGIIAEKTNGMYPYEFDKDNINHQLMRKRTPGAIGCFESQLNVMKKALFLNKNAIVFEDDVVICEDILDRFKYIENWLLKQTKKIDVIWLGGTFHVGDPYWYKDTIGRDAETTDDERMLRSWGSFSTFAYIVLKDSLSTVISMLEDHMKNSIGIDYSFIKLSPYMNNYVFVPGCCKQIDNESDQNPGSGEWTFFSGFSKLGPHWYQERMDMFDPKTYDWKECKIK
jgi:GR25 family glycosyltransferase involved in LPS biosynthesis